VNHLFASLNSAARLAVLQHGYRRSDINLDRWAVTYRTSADDVEQALKLAENGKRKLPEEIAVSTKAPPQVTEVEE